MNNNTTIQAATPFPPEAFDILPVDPPNNMGRLNFAGIYFGGILISTVMLLIFERSASSVALIQGLTLLGLMIPKIYRLQNIGYSGWWVLWSIVPIVGLPVIFACLVLPANYHTARKFDTPTQIILTMAAGVLIVGILFVGLALLKYSN